jgi:formate dehydrogenase maturation protein FdhE
MAALLDPATVIPAEPAGACPVCGSGLASVVYARARCRACASSAARSGLRWHCVRIKCATARPRASPTTISRSNPP